MADRRCHRRVGRGLSRRHGRRRGKRRDDSTAGAAARTIRRARHAAGSSRANRARAARLPCARASGKPPPRHGRQRLRDVQNRRHDARSDRAAAAADHGANHRAPRRGRVLLSTPAVVSRMPAVPVRSLRLQRRDGELDLQQRRLGRPVPPVRTARASGHRRAVERARPVSRCRALGDDRRSARFRRSAPAHVSRDGRRGAGLPAGVPTAPSQLAAAASGAADPRRRPLGARSIVAVRPCRRTLAEAPRSSLSIAARLRRHLRRARLSAVALPRALPRCGRANRRLLDGNAPAGHRSIALRRRRPRPPRTGGLRLLVALTTRVVQAALCRNRCGRPGASSTS